jgi:hypothetical protein
MQTATGTLALVASVSTRSASFFAVASKSIGLTFLQHNATACGTG